jgi:hypothetical protein
MSARSRRPHVEFASGVGAATLFCVGLAVGVSCKSTVANTGHCFYNLGNQTCAERYGEDLPYCATVCAGKDGNAGSPNDDGCVDSEPPVGCYSPCGGENDVADDATCLGAEDTSSTSMTTTTMSTTDMPTTETGTTTPVMCTSSAECPDDAPICVDDECRPCGDAALPDGECGLKDPALAVCDASGACVECTEDNATACGGTSPVCVANACVGCTDHDQCEDACELATGACFPSDCVREVPGDYTTLQAAFDAVAEEPYCVIRVTNDVNGSIVLEETPPRALVYDGAGSVFSLRGTAGSRTLQALEGSTLYIEGLRFDLNPIGAVDAATTSQLYLDDVEIVGNPGDGLRVLTGAYLQMRNSVVAGNGDGTVDTPGVQIYQATADILYSTIVDNDGSAVDTLQCQNSTVTVRNSILMALAGQSISCDEDITFCAVDENVGGMGNTDLSPLDLAWFASAPALDYRLTDDGVDVFGETARWREGDPQQDIDGEARVGMDGASEPAGADVPTPR